MRFPAYTLLMLILLASCEQGGTTSDNPVDIAQLSDTIDQTSLQETSDSSVPVPAVNSQIDIENKRYLFDVTENTREEFSALLSRIDEIMEASPEMFDELEIVMVLHGPDINLFTEKNYAMNKDLVDLAARLDAFKVVDLKVCEASMDSLGVTNMDIPAFIETIPFAPDTMNELREQGYINL